MEIEELDQHADHPLGAVVADPGFNRAKHRKTADPEATGQMPFQGARCVSRFATFKQTTVYIADASDLSDLSTAVLLNQRNKNFRFLLNPSLQLLGRCVSDSENRYLVSVDGPRGS